MSPVSSYACSLAAVAAFLSPAASGAPVPILNPSFETPATGPGTFVVSETAGPSGWTVYNTTGASNQRSFGVWNPSGTPSYVNGAPHGANIGVVFLMNTTNLAEAGLQQTLGATLQLATHYTLTIEVGNFSNAGNPPFNFTGFPGYRIDLMAGNTVVASDNNTLAPGEGIFATSIVSFATGASHANAGQALRIRMVNLNGPGTEVNFDNVRLDATPVPEPSVALMAVVGLFSVAMRHRPVRRVAGG